VCVCSISRLSFGGFGKEVCGTLRVVHCSPLETANELACRESGIVRTERTLLLHDADEAQRFHQLVRTLEVRTFGERTSDEDLQLCAGCVRTSQVARPLGRASPAR